MSSAAIAPRRNPKRARTNAVSYKENTEEDDDQLIDDDEIVWQYEDVDFDAAQVRMPLPSTSSSMSAC